ncbi:peptidyl-prolyl cis-trans isomerase FKBP16-3, chloroplastic isoform X2 [Telopea speciosissima]|uniref:peptidyl-prolyl cis-trans isomerase FKBP16-3, chloroplastic isoform X2 n=1 Tax=Telopea speciosissima TaxID=54955 RepID=UPI001CC477A3|nr:peptidyl-prolyl cis-trans isomerase FKBP16-3, chloroplastic isoform X2 [Telopea speciosissima]
MCIVLDFRYPLEAKRCALFQPSSKWLLRLFFFRLVSSVFGRGASANRQSISRNRSQNLTVQYSASRDRVRPGGSSEYEDDFTLINRRTMIGLIFGISRLAVSFDAGAAGLPPEQMPRLCDDACKEKLENVPMITTESGLQYKDIKVGIGPSPPVGFQVAANYVAMVPSGQIFDSSLEKGRPYIFRVGSEQVIKGLDEGILTMKIGGKRRLYIPGSLAFPKGLNSAPGRPRVAPNSPVVFDVSLEYIPGLELDEE